jgi:hypothetical protein
MAKKSLNLTGTAGVNYDLGKISSETRDNSIKPLVVQVHKYNPNSTDPSKRSPNPKDLMIGQIWVAKEDKDII